MHFYHLKVLFPFMDEKKFRFKGSDKNTLFFPDTKWLPNGGVWLQNTRNAPSVFSRDFYSLFGFVMFCKGFKEKVWFNYIFRLCTHWKWGFEFYNINCEKLPWPFFLTFRHVKIYFSSWAKKKEEKKTLITKRLFLIVDDAQVNGAMFGENV